MLNEICTIMKKIFISLFVIALTATFISCEQEEEALPPALTVTLMKFKEPSYVNHLIVQDTKNSDQFTFMRGNQCSASYLYNFGGIDWTYDFPSLEGRTPYVELLDGWYLVDWPWFQYPYGGQILLTDVTWENYKGEWLFDKSSPHISGNIYERKDIRVVDLVVYSYPDGNYPTFTFRSPNSDYEVELNEYLYISKHIGGPEIGPMHYLDTNGDCLCNRVEEMDNLWGLLQWQLNTLIENGDVYSLPKATKEQYLTLIK